ncbi:MAG: hypothetical protein Q8R24_08625 [Legionellaceae bacterium]|nr:hypothetical protein [Legionellaceae bacterium]
MVKLNAHLFMKLKYVLLLIGLFQNMTVFATSLTPLAFGHAAFLYDAFPLNGPYANPTSNSVSNHPGFWIDSIEAFNAGATAKNIISRLYVYGTSLDTSGSSDTANYNNSYAITSVATYRASFPNTTILAIVDGTPGQLKQGDPVTIQLANSLANSLVTQICADPNVDGIFYDIEPTKFSYGGLFTLYQTTASLLASAQCKDSGHPNGRYMGVYAYVTTGDGSLVKPALGNNGFLAVPLYDVQDSQPPTPTSLTLYDSSAKSYVSNSDANSSTYKIPYTVIGPAGASFGEFEQYGTYALPPPILPASYNFTLITNFSPAIRQVLYMTDVNANTLKYAKSTYYMGVDYYGWNYYVSPIPSQNQLLLPSYPNAETVTYLQKNAF